MNLKFIVNDTFWSIFTILLLITIFVQSSFPSVVRETDFYKLQFDKILHTFVWLILAFSVRLSVNRYFTIDKEEKFQFYLILIILFCAFYGFFDEIHQFFVPSRSADFFDGLFDTIGSIIGTLISHRLITHFSN